MSERRRVPPVTKMSRRPFSKGVNNVNNFQIKHNGKRNTRPKGVVVASDGKGSDGPSKEEVDSNWERIFGKGKYD